MENPLVGRRVAGVGDLELPGDYTGPHKGYTGHSPDRTEVGPNDGIPAVFFLKPNHDDADAPEPAKHIGHVTSPPHVFTEEEDGTLTITASIGDTAGGRPESDGWHGHLTKGVWTKI